MRIGICGGTFDPFHTGHLEPVLRVRERMQWDRVMYVPAYRQPFKTQRSVASGFHRFAMAVLATESHDGIWVSPMELERASISYTVDTLEEVRSMNPEATIDWIIGDDNLASLDAWRNLPRIFELANFTVLTRNGGAPGSAGVPPADLAKPAGLPVISDPNQRLSHGSVVFAHNSTIPVSSTEIRRRVREGEPIDGLVDPRVSRYIHHNQLYREAHL